MKINVKRILFRVTVTLVFCTGLLISFVFNPSFLYAHETVHGNFTIHHSRPLSRDFIPLLDRSFEQLRNDELFDGNIKIEVCLNDGSHYPGLIDMLMGKDVIRTFATISVIQAEMDGINADHLTVKEWNEDFKLSQWLSHSFAHCLQYRKFGLFGSNPLGGYDTWKWEGYAEYASFGTSYRLEELIEKQLEPTDKFWTEMADGSKTNRNHLKFLVMVKYCTEIKKMSYEDILNIAVPEEKVYSEMLDWYHLQENI